MKAIVQHEYGSADVLAIGTAPTPTPAADELLIRIRATALNRADLLQRRGLYPPPTGASPILGLELAGEVAAIGDAVTGWQLGNRVSALLPGGGYAEFATIPAGMAMRLPDHWTYEQGAAVPEVFLTAYSNLFWLGGLTPGQRVLIHAGASGVGTAAIQLVREAGAVAYVTAGSAEKLDFCAQLGASAGWNYHEGSFLPWLQAQTDGQGVNIILDFIGAPYFQDNLQALAMDGRLIIVGTMGGAKVPEVNLGLLLGRRLQVIGTALRSRSITEKIRLTREFAEFADSRFADARMAPIVDSVFDWREVAAAHTRMEANENIGKIVLRVTE